MIHKLNLKISLNFLLAIFTMFASTIALGQAVGGGSVEARFSVDGDLTADTAKFGDVSGTLTKGKNSDDWFRYGLSGSGIGVIDTTGSSLYKYLMQNSAGARDSLAFAMPMAVPKLTRSGGYILLDALYVKDYFDTDSTVVTSSGSKSVDNPGSWTISTGSVQSKDEIMDFYSHVRRKGETVWDSLFFYFGVGIHGTTGNKNVAAELFVNDIQLDKTGDSLKNLGPDGGRTAWLFDGSGNVTRIGDMVVSMSYSPGGGGFTIEPRIWVHDTSIKVGTGAPVNFTWGGSFDFQSGTNFGFADIVPFGSIPFAHGVANNTDTTTAAPWGTIEAASSHNWQAFYEQNQFVEVSINLTALGVDPSLFTGMDPCSVPYRSIVFRSRSSVAFNSDLADFAGPYPFWRYPRVISDIKGTDTLTCAKTTGSVFADSAYSLAWYKWTAINGGNITGYNSDSTAITYNEPGKYVLESAPIRGCWTTKDTVTVLEDALYPVATAEAYDSLVLGSVYSVQLYGGDTAASYAVINSGVFGNSDGLIFEWTGPSGYVATGMKPWAGQAGTYTLRVTEQRNGCSDTASTTLVLLPVEMSDLICSADGSSVKLDWHTYVENGISHFNIERMNSQGKILIGTLNARGFENTTTHYAFIDLHPQRGINTYRVTAISNENAIAGSITCSSQHDGFVGTGIRIYPVPAPETLFVDLRYSEQAPDYEILDMTGRTLISGRFKENSTLNAIDVSGMPSGTFTLKITFTTHEEFVKFIH